jgi:UDP-N-acetylglucosamine:LPS N-acetylglucosamine transferase
MADKEKLTQMKNKALAFASPDAAKKIAEQALAIAVSHES